MPPNPHLLFERLPKEAVHELGHTFGLGHCPDGRCVMAASTYAEDIDLKGDRFCDRCLERLEAHRSDEEDHTDYDLRVGSTARGGAREA